MPTRPFQISPLGKPVAASWSWPDVSFTIETVEAPGPPVFTVAPSITTDGTPAVGETITGVDGTVTGGTVTARQFLRDDAAIPGATGTSRILNGDDGGALIKFQVTASGPGGDTVATSAAVGPISPVLLEPAAQWNGTAGSGFGTANPAAPTDPTRTTAKPAMRLLVPPDQRFTDTLLVGVAAFANNGGTIIGGIDRVRFHFEGNVVEETAPSFQTFNDSNGNPVTYLGYWARLKRASTNGDARLYVTAVPADGTMQNRVLGPFTFYLQATQHDYSLTVAATGPIVAGVSYQTITAAIEYLKGVSSNNPLITVTEAANYTLPQTGSIYAGGKGYCTIVATAPITIGSTSFLGDAVGASVNRPRYDGIWFKGENITFEMRYTSRLFHEGSGKAHVIDGVNITIGGAGRDEYWRSGTRPVSLFSDGTGDRGPIFLEPIVTSYPNACTNSQLVRGGTFNGGYGDLCSNARCVVGTVTDDWDSSDNWGVDVNALTVTGPATSTISLSGANDATSRIITLRVGGSSVGTFTVGRTEALYNASLVGGYDPVTALSGYFIQDVVTWINSVAGWTATVVDNTRRASALSTAGNKGALFTNVACSSPLTLVTMFDIHGDWYQQNDSGTAPVENVIVFGNLATDLVTQNLFITGTGGMKDCIAVNNAFANKAISGQYDNNLTIFSQLGYTHSHVFIAHNSMSLQGWGERSGSSYNADAYSVFTNNAVRSIALTTASGLDIEDCHIQTSFSAPAGSVNVTVGGTDLTLFVDAAGGDFTPAGALLSDLKARTFVTDLNRATRAASDAAGAVKVA